ncbi:response regulator [Luteolibacter yonseiensis]|uniref:Response regulator n=1 Tax=Luteolibacter yonseiensis TaxID=1144680 RepID=A0A934R0L0_9BACT|nr:response regulator [Luteolibacter yonseiensis]MBK1816183.1 response regulator [Luteolibacter yonseiensis]
MAVIDDDDSLCRSLGRLLRAVGIQPVTYSSAEAFLADEKQPRFDCLLLDIELGGMSGIELNERLVASGSTAPVIFNTAHDEPGIRTSAMRTGCSAFLKKTDSGQTIMDAITRAIGAGPVEGGR